MHNGKTVNAIVKPMIRLSSADDTYEPYGASPSPEYPSKIRNVGDNVQLFDKDNANILNAYIRQADKTILSSSSTKLVWIEIKPNTTYTVSKIKSKKFNIATTVNEPQLNTVCTELNSDSNSTSLTINSKDNDNYLVIFYYDATEDTLTEQEILDSIKIEQGSKATPYTPYGYGSADIKVQNKNLCTKTVLQNANNIQFHFDPQMILKTFSISFDINVSLNRNSLYLRIDGKDASQKLIAQITNSEGKVNKTVTFTDTVYNELKSGKTAYFLLYKNSADFTLPTYSQIENNPSVTDYVPHEEQTLHFPLAKPLHKGDYLADDGIHQKRKTIIFDGTEDSWSIGNYNTENFFYRYRYLTDYMYDAKQNNFICSHFKAGNVGSTNTEEGIFIVNNGEIRIRFGTEMSLEDFKAYLAEQYANDTPVVIEYELAEEIVEAYTEEQKEAYNYLQHLLMYENYNYITCINEIKPNLQLTYYYNNELNKTYAKRLDELEKEVNTQINEVNEQLTNVYEEFMKKEENETILNLTIPPTGGSDSYVNYPNGFNSENCYVAGVMMYRKHPDNQTYTTWYNLSGNYYVRLEVNKVVLNVGVDFSEQYLGNQAKIILKKYTD